MVVNVELTDEEAGALGGNKVTMTAPPETQNLPLGILALQDVEAVISAAGITIGFALEPEEVRAIQRGGDRFLLHFHMDPLQGVPPFRFIFERVEFNLDNGSTPEKSHPEFRLQEPEGESEAD